MLYSYYYHHKIVSGNPAATQARPSCNPGAQVQPRGLVTAGPMQQFLVQGLATLWGFLHVTRGFMEVLTEQKWWFNVDIVGKDIVKKTVSFRRILKDRKQNLVVGPFFLGRFLQKFSDQILGMSRSPHESSHCH